MGIVSIRQTGKTWSEKLIGKRLSAFTLVLIPLGVCVASLIALGETVSAELSPFSMTS
jgi:hypothetical protein